MPYSNLKLFSLQADASVDAGNVELELFMILHFEAFSIRMAQSMSIVFFLYQTP